MGIAVRHLEENLAIPYGSGERPKLLGVVRIGGVIGRPGGADQGPGQAIERDGPLVGLGRVPSIPAAQPDQYLDQQTRKVADAAPP